MGRISSDKHTSLKEITASELIILYHRVSGFQASGVSSEGSKLYRRVLLMLRLLSPSPSTFIYVSIYQIKSKYYYTFYYKFIISESSVHCLFQMWYKEPPFATLPKLWIGIFL